MIWIAPSSTAYLSARTSSGLPSLSPVPSWPLRRKWVAMSWSMTVFDASGPVRLPASSSPASCSRTIWSSGRSALNARMT